MSSRSAGHARRLPCLALPLFACALAAQAPTPTAASSRVTPIPAPDATARAFPFVSTAADGTVWARGADWKASFAADGATFVPFLGSDAPRNYPLQLRTARLLAGTSEIALTPPTVRAGERRVDLDHGRVVETWLLARDQAEQRFVFAAPLGEGPLAVRMQVDTELVVASDGNGGFTFANERGGVRYGRAIAFDARGQRTDVASHCDGGALTLTVPAAFVAGAVFPLTIDPVVSTFGLMPGAGTLDESNTDCAYVGTFNGLYVSVHEEHYSAADHDVLAVGRDRDGNFVTSNYVDYTTTNWATPAVASHRGQSQFLAVAARGPAGSNNTEIWGCTLTWGGGGSLTPSVQFVVSAFAVGKNPDVGGDPNPSPPAPGNYCVCWQGTTDGELYYNIVRTDTSLWAFTGIQLEVGPEVMSNPAISKSCGVGAAPTQEWNIVWQKRYSPTDEDIYGTRIGVDGVVRTLEFLIDYSGSSDTDPEVSSLTDTTGAGVERFAVVYQRDFPSTPFTPTHSDVMGQLFQTTTSITGTVNLSTLLGGGAFSNDYAACVDTDGQRFAVGYTRWTPFTSANSAPYLSTLHVVNDQFAVTALPELVNGYQGNDERLRITSERSGGSFTPRYMVSWHTEHTTPAPSAAGALGAFYWGHVALGPTSYFAHTIPGCGPLTLSASGLPALAQVFQLDLTNAQGIPFLIFGGWLANPVTVCSNCVLGMDLSASVIVQATSVPVFVPPNANLIATAIGAQGFDLFAPNGCTSPFPYTLTDCILITIL